MFYAAVAYDVENHLAVATTANLANKRDLTFRTFPRRRTTCTKYHYIVSNAGGSIT